MKTDEKERGDMRGEMKRKKGRSERTTGEKVK